jgi:hypothetical protein
VLQQAVTEIQQQQQQGQFQVVSRQQQQAQASLRLQQDQQQQLADRQPQQQQRLPSTALRQQQPQQQLRRRAVDPSSDLLAAIQTAGGYSQLCALVGDASSRFQPHHTAAALLRLADIVTGRDLLLQQAAAASAEELLMFAEQDWAGPPMASLDAAADRSPGSPGSPGSASRDDGYSSSSSSLGGVNGYASRSSMSSSSLARYGSMGAGRGNGLAGLIAMPGSELASSTSSTSDEMAASAAAEAAGFLSGATMAARMARARQQQWEQQQLRQQAWGLLPTQQQQWLDAAGGADALAAQQQQQQLDGSSAGMLDQQQQWLQQQQQVVDYGPLLRRLLTLVRNQAENMSGSAGLTVLTALSLMRAPIDSSLLQRLLKHPLWGGLSKLRPEGLVAVGARLAALQAQPSQRWLRRYVELLQQRRDVLSGQQLSSLVGSLRALGWRSWPEVWGTALAARCSSALPSMEGRELLQVAQVRPVGLHALY